MRVGGCGVEVCEGVCVRRWEGGCVRCEGGCGEELIGEGVCEGDVMCEGVFEGDLISKSEVVLKIQLVRMCVMEI